MTWTEPDIGTCHAWESADPMERDRVRLALRIEAAALAHPYAREPVYGPFPINEDSEP